MQLFRDHPELWDFDMARLGGAISESIDNQTASEYGSIAASLGLDASAAAVGSWANRFCKLFISPRGAATRMHQDNHHAHAWLSQVRGRKLYVLCAPQDYALVAPLGKSTDEGGTTREGRFDPLDPAQRAARMRAGLRVYATILQPGETIVSPDSWWHYAMTLSPSITLMCNFWDAKNRAGVKDMVMRGCSPAPPQRPLGGGPRHFKPATAHRAVVLRDGPNPEGSQVVGALRPGEARAFDAECGDWLRGSGPEPHIWARRDELLPA